MQCTFARKFSRKSVFGLEFVRVRTYITGVAWVVRAGDIALEGKTVTEIPVVSWANTNPGGDTWADVEVYYPSEVRQEHVGITHSFARRINRARLGLTVRGRTAEGALLTVRIRERWY